MYLALDQGGHATRAVLLDDRGGCLSYVVVPVADHRPGRGRVEQDPSEILASVRAAARLAVARARLRPGAIRSIGIATQRSGIVCWDRDSGAPLSPVLSWQDRRCGVDLDDPAFRAAGIRERTGLPLSPHYGAGKIRWCLDRLPSVRSSRDAGTLACGPLSSYLLFRLTEERTLGVDPVSAQRTLLWNRHSRKWDADLSDLFGIPAPCLPPCTPTRHRYGSIILGGAGVPLEIVTGDQNAAVYARGKPRVDTVHVNLGTGAFALRSFRSDPGLFPGLLTGIGRLDGRSVDHHLEGTVNGAAGALLWFEKRSRVPELWHHLPSWLDSDTEPPLFLNGISGLGSPFWVPRFRSRFVGGGPPAARAVAVVESVVFLLRTILASMAPAGPEVRRIHVSGGLSLLDGLCRRLAGLAGVPVVRFPNHEATARGAARLAAGLPASWADPVDAADRFPPSRDRSLERRFRRWREVMEEELSSRYR